MWRIPVIIVSQWKKVLEVFRKYQLSHIPISVYGYCHKVIQPSAVRWINRLHYTENEHDEFRVFNLHYN
jgi:hypothetical protein